MIKKLLPALLVILTMASCSSLKPLNSSVNKQVSSGPAIEQGSTASKPVKFLDNISVEHQSATVQQEAIAKNEKKQAARTSSDDINYYINHSSSVENASSLQLKYAILLNTEVEQLQNTRLLESVDEWYGTRYRMGGTSKSGIDCSAFVQAVYLSAFAFSLPRTAREQYKNSHIISTTELQEGDLVFFNTRGGISHVGIYLRNNKFIHASTSQGVTVSDMFDPYYLKRYIGAGRIEKGEILSVK